MEQSKSSNQREYSVVKTGGIANPAEVKRAILEATKDIKRADRDFDKIIADKEELLADLAELRMHEKQAEEKTLPASVKKVIERSVRSLQKRLSILNGVLPEVNLSADQKKIQTIIAEWKEGKRNFRNAYGAHLRAERKLAENPANHRAMGDANRAEAEMYVDTQKMDALAKEAEIIVGRTTPDPVRDEAVNMHTGEVEKVREVEKVGKINVVEPATVTAPPWLSVELPAPPARELIDDHTHHAPHEESRAYEEREEVREHEEVPAMPDVVDQTEEISESEEVITAEEIKDTESPTEEAGIEAEILELAQTQTGEEKSPALMYAEKTLHSHLDTLFGEKGFLGFGGARGKDSPHWNDAERGFEKKIIEEVRAAQPRAEPDLIGIENATEVATMRAYIEKAQEETGVPPLPYESVSDYIIRALSMAHEDTVSQE